MSDQIARLEEQIRELSAQLARIENIVTTERLANAQVRLMLFNHAWLEPLPAPVAAPHYLSVVCCARNEGPYLREWLEYHRLVGVEHFYFYDNGSTDDTRALLEPYIRAGVVDYRLVEGRLMQTSAYQDALLRARGQTYWLALIDLDEFIVPVQHDTIPDFLQEYEHYHGVAINWVNFDCDGHEARPLAHDGLVTANYTRTVADHDRFERDLVYKCIVRPERVAYIMDPHIMYYRRHVLNAMPCSVTENFEPADTTSKATPRHSAAKIRINHYYTKSRAEMEAKKERGSANIQGYATYNSRELYTSPCFPEDMATARDTLIIDKYLSRLQERLRHGADAVLPGGVRRPRQAPQTGGGGSA